MGSDLLTWVLRGGIGLVFIVAGGSKLIHPGVWIETLQRLGLGDRLRRITGVTIPVVEMTLGGAILIPQAAALSSILMICTIITFSIVVVLGNAQHKLTGGCACFGPLWRLGGLKPLLLRNAVLILLAALVTLVGP
jgi:uncharacterized membrane protein YphA (DoxX/SURF4 family)